jgi:hypothetical protein
VRRKAVALRPPDHLSQAFHRFVVGLVQGLAAGSKQCHRQVDTGGLVDTGVTHRHYGVALIKTIVIAKLIPIGRILGIR